MGKAIILDKFSQWTKGYSEKKAIISIYNRIRDIPYAIIPELRAPDIGPAGLLELNKGSCQPKHWLLALLFKKLGIPIKYVTYPFKWSKCPIKYPEEFKKILPNLPISYHLAIKAHINNNWILVDATYDLPLAKVGFPVTKEWDGISNTINAVDPLDEIIHETPQERVSYETKQKSLYTEKEKAALSEFIEKLNLWLDNVRNK